MITLPNLPAPPTRIQVLPARAFRTADGRELAYDAARLVAAVNASPFAVVPLDLEHAEVRDAPAGKPSPAQARLSGFHVGADGAVYANATWTPGGLQTWSNGSYRAVAPAVFVNARGELAGIHSVALTRAVEPAISVNAASFGVAVNSAANEIAKRCALPGSATVTSATPVASAPVQAPPKPVAPPKPMSEIERRCALPSSSGATFVAAHAVKSTTATATAPAPETSGAPAPAAGVVAAAAEHAIGVMLATIDRSYDDPGALADAFSNMPEVTYAAMAKLGASPDAAVRKTVVGVSGELLRMVRSGDLPAMRAKLRELTTRLGPSLIASEVTDSSVKP